MIISISAFLQSIRQLARPKRVRKKISKLITQINNLIECLTLPEIFFNELDAAKKTLKSLPLAATEYDFAIDKLKKAQRYLDSRELGAARYELRVLITFFKTMIRDR